MPLTRTRCRLTALGWLGAALFVLPTPIIGYLVVKALQWRPGAYEAALARVSGDPTHLFAAAPNPALLVALSTATMVGLVLLIVGRETVTTSAD